MVPEVNVGRISATVLCGMLGCFPAVAEEPDRRPAAGIQDNSFLIEEAYNQEPGVVQHIATFRRQKHDRFFAFTQEWPVFSQAHQFSYTVPYTWIRSDDRRSDGAGDVLLNYRYQLLEETDAAPAVAPRLSLILPTGDFDRGLGNDSYGLQVNLPVSKIVADRLTLHGNAGATSYFDSKGRSPTGFNLGTSAIFALAPQFNLMIEALREWGETADADGVISREAATTVSPGARYAFNLEVGQLVLGAAAPIQLKGGDATFGALVYLSFEHGF
jgi:hypothetical protein